MFAPIARTTPPRSSAAATAPAAVKTVDGDADKEAEAHAECDTCAEEEEGAKRLRDKRAAENTTTSFHGDEHVEDDDPCFRFICYVAMFCGVASQSALAKWA